MSSREEFVDTVFNSKGEVLEFGLTKREHAAIQIAAGVHASNVGQREPDMVQIAKTAAAQADALFDELEKDNGQ